MRSRRWQLEDSTSTLVTSFLIPAFQPVKAFESEPSVKDSPAVTASGKLKRAHSLHLRFGFPFLLFGYLAAFELRMIFSQIERARGISASTSISSNGRAPCTGIRFRL